MTNEVDLNITNTYFSEDRYSDAERLYSTALKTYTLHNKASNILFAYLLEMISVSQLFCGRFGKTLVMHYVFYQTKVLV